MKLNENNKQTVTLEKPVKDTQIHIVVDGCKVKLNFPPKSESSTVNDIKRMMLGGVIKS